MWRHKWNHGKWRTTVTAQLHNSFGFQLSLCAYWEEQSWNLLNAPCMHYQQLCFTLLQRFHATYVGVGMVNKHCQCWKNFTDHIDRRRRVLVTAEVHHDPRDVPQKRERNIGINERDEWLNNAQADDVVPTLRTITWTCHQSTSDIWLNCKSFDFHFKPNNSLHLTLTLIQDKYRCSQHTAINASTAFTDMAHAVLQQMLPNTVAKNWKIFKFLWLYYP